IPGRFANGSAGCWTCGAGAGGGDAATGMQNPALASKFEPCTHGSGVAATGTHRPVRGSVVRSIPHTVYSLGTDTGVADGWAPTKLAVRCDGNVATTPSTAMYTSASQKGTLKALQRPRDGCGVNCVPAPRE